MIEEISTSITSSNENQSISKNESKFIEIVNEPRKGIKRFLALFWALIGPGVLAAMADNDAGGSITYAVTGAKYGIGLFIPLVLCLVIVTYTVQELSMRLSTVTQEGFTTLVHRHYGRFWLCYHVITLFLENLLMLSTEFMGMTAGLVILGLPIYVADIFSLALVIAIIIFTGYWTKERLAIFIGVLNFAFVVLAFFTHPSMASIGNAFATWSVPANSGNIFMYIVAIIGNSVAPWMIFFQGNACIDKGVIKEHLRLGRIDTCIGCVVQVIIAACLIIAGAALFGHVPNIENLGPAEIISAFNSNVGRLPAILFGIGIFNAGLLASFTISLSSSWSVAEAFGWTKSLNNKVKEAPKFYAVYIGSVIVAATAILIPNLPLNAMAVFAQIICGLLMAPILIFLALLTNKKDLMGEYKNSLFLNIRAWAIASVLIGSAVLLILNTFAG